MENVRATSRPAVWLMFSMVFVALNLRPSMAAVGPLLSAIRGDIPLSFSRLAADHAASHGDGAGDVLGYGIANAWANIAPSSLSLLIIGVATVSRLFLDSG